MQYFRGFLAVSAILSLVLALPPASAQPGTGQPEAPVPAVTVVAEAADYASDTFGDPWDFDNAEDAHTWNPAVIGGTASLAGGRYRFSLPGPGGGHLPLIFPGFDGAMPTGRDGDVRPLDTGHYRTAVLRIHASSPVTAAVVTDTCPGVTRACDNSGADLQLQQGWHTYQVALPPATPAYGLRLAIAAGPRDIALDWVRIIAGTPATVPVSGQGQVFWDADGDTSTNTADDPGWGPVVGGAFPAGAYPPGAYAFYTASGDGSAADPTRSPLSVPLHVLARPATVVLDPDETGGEDYITAQTGRGWDFTSADDGIVGNARDVVVADGRLSATNTTNDPFVTMRMGATPIDPLRYHRLTVTFTNEGPFDLSFDPGGGSHGRLLWSTQDPALLRWNNGNDISSYPNAPTHTFDLRAALAVDEDEPAGTAWSTAPVTAIRFDPNEDPGPRRWHLHEIRIAADDETSGGGFDVTFDDTAFDVPAPAGTAVRYEVFADTDRAGNDGVLVASGPVTNRRTVARWQTAGVAPGTYWIHVRVVREAGGVAVANDTYATGPLQVRPQDTSGTPTPPPADPSDPDPDGDLRIAGPSRFDTAAELARESFPDGASTAVVVTGQAFADALSAAPLATALGGPVLLAARDQLPDATRAALRDLEVEQVVVLGGTAAIGQTVADQLASDGLSVRRISGPDRFATAAAVGEEMQAIGAVTDEVVIASGSTFPDALAGGWHAAVLGTPLLLIGDDGVSAATAELIQSLGVTRATVVGGSAVVSDQAMASLRALGLEVRRLAGDSRWATAAAVAAETPVGAPAGVLVASGEDFPDALAAGPAAAATGRVLALTAKESLPGPTAALIASAGDVPIRVVGGPAAIASSTLGAIAAVQTGGR